MVGRCFLKSCWGTPVGVRPCAWGPPEFASGGPWLCSEALQGSSAGVHRHAQGPAMCCQLGPRDLLRFAGWGPLPCQGTCQGSLAVVC